MKEKFKVIEISELNVGYLVNDITTNKDRQTIERKILSFQKKDEVLNYIKSVLE